MKKILLAATALTAMTAVAHAADLPRRYAAPAPVAPAYVAPVFTWTGFYVGANAGGAVGGDIKTSTPGATSETSIGGFLVGGTVGYNYQFAPGDGLVLGVEGDIGYADIQARDSFRSAGLTETSKAGIDGYFGTIRGRVGYAMGSWLFYGTGGWAFADGRTSLTSTSPFATTSISRSKGMDGYVVGGGVEYAITPAMSVKAEYLYADFEKQRVTTPGGAFVPAFNTTTSVDTHLLKVGVNYRFNSF